MKWRRGDESWNDDICFDKLPMSLKLVWVGILVVERSLGFATALFLDA